MHVHVNVFVTWMRKDHNWHYVIPPFSPRNRLPGGNNNQEDFFFSPIGMSTSGWVTVDQDSSHLTVV